ncbi:cold shock domain-containing protein [Streptomyces sp. ASQP_92]|uniref:cold shock domain-containing protein n=1 Tax=unclassified Streptomyces TaxID=2593676 RepID=UPI0021C1A5B9|nr:cold shock domain-containing protein [Streptomyces sp. ASQP_92]MCT9088666.1 cold shock domain-containing protein [Streptomyces sp. ASQP_92]
MNERCEGIVQYFDREKGYGFVVPIGQHDGIYVRREDIEGETRTLSEGQRVSFVIELARGRFEARAVRP